jgi:SAM-dependent methyltransferase
VRLWTPEGKPKETMMDIARETDQTTLWNGPGGRAWVDAQEVMDQVLKPFEDLLVEAVSARGLRGRALDVGCGTGGTTLAVARRLGTKGECIGIDVSEPMIAAARGRAAREGAPATFIRADAQEHAFEPASFDMILSRFGVMFFDDLVRAFANLRRAAKARVELRFVTWRSPAENPFMTTAERAAAPLLSIPARRLEAPGPFALADERRLYGILQESGWAEIDIAPLDVVCTLPEKELIGYLTRFGPLGLALCETDERTRANVIEIVRAAFDPFVEGAVVRFTAACWTVGARAP